MFLHKTTLCYAEKSFDSFELKMLQGTEIPSVCNGLFQTVAAWQHANSKPPSCNRISASTTVPCRGVNCRFKEACMESKEFYGESHKLPIFRLMTSLCEDLKNAS